MKFSIIVPTYNSSKYISRCLNSIKCQTIQDFEVLIIDAGSEDDTKNKVEKFDERYHLHELPGSSQGEARNLGIEISSGEYICFLDSDDFYLSYCLENHLNAFKNDNQLMAHYGAVYAYRTNNKKKFGLKRSNYIPDKIDQYIAGLNHNLAGMCISKIIKDTGIRFQEGENGRMGEEAWFQYKIEQLGYKGSYLDIPLAFVEMREDSHTQWENQWKMKLKRLNDLKVMISQSSHENNNLYPQKILDKAILKLGISYLLSNEYKKSRECLRSIDSKVFYVFLKISIYIRESISKKLFSYYATKLWLIKQNSTFKWRSLNKEVMNEFIKLNKFL